MLPWASYRNECKELYDSRELKGNGECYDTLFKILGLQFSTLEKIKQLIYFEYNLVPCALASLMLANSPLEHMEMWLANIHDIKRAIVKQSVSYRFSSCKCYWNAD